MAPGCCEVNKCMKYMRSMIASGDLFTKVKMVRLVVVKCTKIAISKASLG